MTYMFIWLFFVSWSVLRSLDMDQLIVLSSFSLETENSCHQTCWYQSFALTANGLHYPSSMSLPSVLVAVCPGGPFVWCIHICSLFHPELCLWHSFVLALHFVLLIHSQHSRMAYGVGCQRHLSPPVVNLLFQPVYVNWFARNSVELYGFSALFLPSGLCMYGTFT